MHWWSTRNHLVIYFFYIPCTSCLRGFEVSDLFETLSESGRFNGRGSLVLPVDDLLLSLGFMYLCNVDYWSAEMTVDRFRPFPWTLMEWRVTSGVRYSICLILYRNTSSGISGSLDAMSWTKCNTILALSHCKPLVFLQALQLLVLSSNCLTELLFSVANFSNNYNCNIWVNCIAPFWWWIASGAIN